MTSKDQSVEQNMTKEQMLLYYPGFRNMDVVSAIVSSYFSEFSVQFFGHLSVWPEGKYSVVCSKHEWPLEFVYRRLPPIGFRAYDQITDRIIFPNMKTGNTLAVSDEMVLLAKKQFNLLNPMVILRKYEDHYQAFGFDMNVDNVYNVYINNLELFENFIHYYKYECRKIIEAANKRPVYIDAQYLSPNTDPENVCYHDEKCAELLQLKKYYLRYKGKEISVSGKEYYCLCLLAHGKQVKSIANSLGVSTRTAQTYCERLKAKLNIVNREDLVSVYWENRIIQTPILKI